MMDNIDTHHGLPRSIRREKIFIDVFEMYEENLINVLDEFPFRIKYKNEKAYDTGGVCRDMFSSFWDEVFVQHFDGERLVVPSVRPGVDMAKFKILGTILAHGFMVCGFLPVRVAFPVIASVLLGTDVKIPDIVLMESFVDFLASYESSILRDGIVQAQTDHTLTPTTKSSLIDLLSRFGCTEMPTSKNLLQLITGVAKHYILGKTFGTLYSMRSGVPLTYYDFWRTYTVEDVFDLYKALNATTTSVLRSISEPNNMNAAEERVYSYLIAFVGNMKSDELRLFMRFVTGSSVMIAKTINVSFNNITGLARRPISHTCDCGLELSISYSTFPEFEQEFYKVLSNEYSWIMDAL